jgi:thioesterase domain-containing protein
MIEQYGENNTNYITFENLAQNYIQYIKLIQAKGPYNLFGWSFGGVLAFEIARQLSIKGEIVNNLFLLDPYFDYKKVLDKLDITTLGNNINYKYSPKFVTAMTDTKIILFKATKVIPKIQNQESEDTRIANYFALKTKYNNLDHLVDRNSIERIPINSTHEDLINNKFLLNYINKIEL